MEGAPRCDAFRDGKYVGLFDHGVPAAGMENGAVTLEQRIGTRVVEADPNARAGHVNGLCVHRRR
jgi:hypothetical protein